MTHRPDRPDNRRRALDEAARRAADRLAEADLAATCRRLHLPAPGPDGRLRLTMLDRDIVLTPPAMRAEPADGGPPVAPADRLLLLRYLLCPVDPSPRGEWISFRQFPGGLFYWGPFRSRSLEPLIAAIGNDLKALHRRLDRFRWRPADPGDLGARVHVLGPVEVLLVYHASDEEFGPEANLLFDAEAPRYLAAEDAAHLAGRVCLPLCRQAPPRVVRRASSD